MLRVMDSSLPTTGTAELLRTLSPYVPDRFIDQLLPALSGRGRRRAFSSSQLWRAHLLALLTPVHSLNLLVQMLPEQRDWRRFAHLPQQRRLPDVRMLHEFRTRAGVSGLRRINEELVTPLLPPRAAGRYHVALIDATDLPAATCGFKKRAPGSSRRDARRSAPAP
jgi:hypothetical protein